jgi:hypothetical protein
MDLHAYSQRMLTVQRVKQAGIFDSAMLIPASFPLTLHGILIVLVREYVVFRVLAAVAHLMLVAPLLVLNVVL